MAMWIKTIAIGLLIIALGFGVLKAFEYYAQLYMSSMEREKIEAVDRTIEALGGHVDYTAFLEEIAPNIYRVKEIPRVEDLAPIRGKDEGWWIYRAISFIEFRGFYYDEFKWYVIYRIAYGMDCEEAKARASIYPPQTHSNSILNWSCEDLERIRTLRYPGTLDPWIAYLVEMKTKQMKERPLVERYTATSCGKNYTYELSKPDQVIYIAIYNGTHIHLYYSWDGYKWWDDFGKNRSALWIMAAGSDPNMYGWIMNIARNYNINIYYLYFGVSPSASVAYEELVNGVRGVCKAAAPFEIYLWNSPLGDGWATAMVVINGVAKLVFDFRPERGSIYDKDTIYMRLDIYDKKVEETFKKWLAELEKATKMSS
jgi:hypothetical protein